jgi:putative membrane protein
MKKMKKNFLVIAAATLFLTACNDSGKDSVEKADSINEAKHDTSINTNATPVDETSSEFLVRVANAGLTEVELTSMAQQKAVNQSVKDLAATLHKDHMALNDQVKTLAGQKNITLPTVVSDEKKKDIEDLRAKTGTDFDKSFISTIIKAHESSIESFEKAINDTKDADVKSFADKTLPTLRSHLQAAKDVEKNIK